MFEAFRSKMFGPKQEFTTNPSWLEGSDFQKQNPDFKFQPVKKSFRVEDPEYPDLGQSIDYQTQPGARDRVQQIADSGAQGSYLQAASKGLKKVTPLVGNFAAGDVDKTWAQKYPEWNQPFSKELADKASKDEGDAFRSMPGAVPRVIGGNFPDSWRSKYVGMHASSGSDDQH